MSERSEITRKLRLLVEKRLDSQKTYWSPEVNFDKNTQKERRIDFVSFKAYTPNIIVEPTSVELGTFACYEVKSGMADFKSGNGLTFYGDENYLVCMPDFADELVRRHGQEGLKFPRNLTDILIPDKSGKRLYRKKIGMSWDTPHRLRPASEMLWAIVQSHDLPHISYLEAEK